MGDQELSEKEKGAVLIDKEFFKDIKEADEMLNTIQNIIQGFSTPGGLAPSTERDVVSFLEEMWKRFSIDRYAKVFVDFARTEKALYGRGTRYRDHLIHVFNIFVMGLILFSKMIERDSSKAFELMKVCKEPENVPFMMPYNKQRRLYYIWGLMSTFHDIAIPIQYRKDTVEGLRLFLGHFKIETEKPLIEFPLMIHADFSRYSKFMANLFADGIILDKNETEPSYELPEEPTSAYLYFRLAIENAMNRNDHGVFGAYLLLKSVEEMFLSGQNLNPDADLDLDAIVYDGKVVKLPDRRVEWANFIEELGLEREEFESLLRIYNLEKGETNSYNKYVLMQDVSRAALGIALHNLNPESREQPKIFPLRFSKLPLCFILTLLDELQEFCRPEGLELTEIVRFQRFPKIDVVFLTKNPIRFRIILTFELHRQNPTIEKKLVDDYNKYIQDLNKPGAKNYEHLVYTTWENIFNRLRKKLLFDAYEEPIELHVIVNYNNETNKSLSFKSHDWSKDEKTERDVGWQYYYQSNRE